MTTAGRTEERFSLLVRFDRDRVASKKFFSPQGFHYWDELNNQYQGILQLKLLVPRLLVPKLFNYKL
jgi:hypothetical protein